MVPARLPGELGWFLHFNMCNFRLISLLTWEYHLGFNMLQIFKQQTGQRCSHDERKVSVPRLYEDLFVTLFNPVLLKILGEKTRHGVPFLFRQPALCWWLTQFDEIVLFENCFVVFCKGILFNPVSNHSIFQQKHWTEPEIKNLPFFHWVLKGDPVFITNQPPAYHQPRSATKAGGFFDFDDLPDASPPVEGGGLQPNLRHFAGEFRWSGGIFQRCFWDE